MIAPTIISTLEDYLQQRQNMIQLLKNELATAQNIMKQAVDKKRSDQEFSVGDKLYLKVKRFLQHSFSTTPISKLSPKYFVPYTILAKVSNVAYQLQLPKGNTTHPVFHVSLLKKAVEPIATTS